MAYSYLLIHAVFIELYITVYICSYIHVVLFVLIAFRLHFQYLHFCKQSSMKESIQSFFLGPHSYALVLIAQLLLELREIGLKPFV